MDEVNELWHEVDHDSAWMPFYERFGFVPDYYERTHPAIVIPPDALVIDLSPVYERNGPRFAAGEAAVNASALRAFVWLAEDEDLVALDWHHPSYRYSPELQALSDDEPARQTLTAVARDFRLHRTTVTAIRDRHDAPVRAQYTTNAHIDQARALRATGASFTEIGRRLGCDPRTISNRLREQQSQAPIQ